MYEKLLNSTNYALQNIVEIGAAELKKAQIPNYSNEIIWMLCDILKCKYFDIKQRNATKLSDDEILKLNKYINDRVKGCPLQYILGYAPFYGRDFLVNKNVLIPRPETELIIDIVSKYNNIQSALEIGTGCGCISITMSLEKSIDTIIATDISYKTLDVANKNCKKFNVDNIDFIYNNFLNDDNNLNSKFDVIVSNPPYINKFNYNNLDNNVKNYEPEIALTDQSDGLTFYYKFSEIAANLMHDDSRLLLEFGGNNQLNDIIEIFANYKIKIFNDLQNDPRIIQVSL